MQHFDLLFVVAATEQLALLDHVLFAFLQLNAAHDARETFQMEHIVGGAHHQLVGTDVIATAQASIFHVQPKNEHKKLHSKSNLSVSIFFFFFLMSLSGNKSNEMKVYICLYDKRRGAETKNV